MSIMSSLDLQPATDAVAALVADVRDDQLNATTPCPAYSVADLVEHIGGLSVAFAEAARKSPPVGGSRQPAPDGSRLEPGWRERVVADLDTLAESWRDPAAYEGHTEAGGVQLTGAEAGIVAL